MTGKRQLRDLLYEPKPKESPPPERLRDEKYREKFGDKAKQPENPPPKPMIVPLEPQKQAKPANKNLD
jgi:hypothetical protein